MDLREFIIAISGIALTGYIIRRFNTIRIRYRDLDIFLTDRPRDPQRDQPVPERGQLALIDRPRDPQPEQPDPERGGLAIED